MKKNSVINMRVNENIKIEAERILNNLGLNISSAIDLFLNQVIR
jgi:addiction module RelB/DinJ family antitoxin